MKKGKKGLALAMTLAVTMTSVPTAFALDGNAQPTKQPDNQLGQRDTDVYKRQPEWWSCLYPVQ